MWGNNRPEWKHGEDGKHVKSPREGILEVKDWETKTLEIYWEPAVIQTMYSNKLLQTINNITYWQGWERYGGWGNSTQKYGRLGGGEGMMKMEGGGLWEEEGDLHFGSRQGKPTHAP